MSTQVKSEMDVESNAAVAAKRSTRAKKRKTDPEEADQHPPLSNPPSLEQEVEEQAEELNEEDEEEEFEEEDEEDYEEEEEDTSKRKTPRKSSTRKSAGGKDASTNGTSSANRSNHRLPTCPFDKGTFVLRLMDLTDHEQARSDSIWKVDSAQLLLRYKRKNEDDNTTYYRTQNYTAWAMAADENYMRLEVSNITKTDDETVVVKYPSDEDISLARNSQTTS